MKKGYFNSVKLSFLLIIIASANFSCSQLETNKAYKAQEKFDYKNSISIWEELLAKDSLNALYWNNYGWVLLKYGELEKSLFALQKANKIASSNENSHLLSTISINLEAHRISSEISTSFYNKEYQKTLDQCNEIETSIFNSDLLRIFKLLSLIQDSSNQDPQNISQAQSALIALEQKYAVFGNDNNLLRIINSYK